MKKIIALTLLFTLFTTSIFAKVRYISPNNDGVQDELVLPLQISDKRYVQGWSLIIMNENKEVIRVIENKVSLPEKVGFKSFFKQIVTPKQGVQIPESISWNGAMDNGETAPDGKYTYYLTATDDNGNVGRSKEYEIVVDTIAPEVEVTQPTDKIFGEGAKNFFKITQEGSEEDLWIGTFKDNAGNVVKTVTWKSSGPETFNWMGTNDEGTQVVDGVYSYEITAKDRAGNVAPQTTITNIIYSAEKPATNIIINGSKYFSPKTDSKLQNITFDVTIPVPEAKTGNQLLEWAVQIEDSNGKVVRSFNQNNSGAVPPKTVVFDGTDDAGNLLSDGEYKAAVTAKYSNGYIPAKLMSPVVVMDTVSPKAQITSSSTIFGGGDATTVTFKILRAPDFGSPVPAWKGVIQTVPEEGSPKVVRTFDFGEYPPETVSWNGVTDKGSIAENAQYVLILEASDLAGNASVGLLSPAVQFDTTKTKILLGVSDSAFSPNGDKVKDTIVFTPITETKAVDNYEFVVKSEKGDEVYKASGTKTLPVSFVWDGKSSERSMCKDGFYSATLFVEATNHSKDIASTQMFELDTVKPELTAEIPWTYFSPNGDGNQDDIPVKITNSTKEKLWTAEVRDSKDKTVKKFTWNNSKTEFAWDGSDEAGNIAADGKYSILIHSADEAGNSFSTELKEIVLDNREAKAYITAELEGISPNDDGYLDLQKFEIKLSVTDNIKSWKFSVCKEDGSPVYSLTDKNTSVLPSNINWNGADKDGKVCEGTFMGTIEVEYLNGNHINQISSPFICTATPPQLKVKTATADSGTWFSPDNDGVDDDLFIQLTGTTKAKIKNWTFTIKDPKGKDFWKTSGKSQPAERIIWDGLSNVQKDSSGKAERVQSAMDYPYSFVVTDNLGMTSISEGVIQVDVLVIREGNVLKMAVPSIIFESDSANFQTANAKLSAEQISKNLATLDRIAVVLKKFKDYKVTIVGHANKITDNPEEETVDNLRVWGRALTPLSAERADAIKAYLVKKGVNAASISTDGLGGTKPVVDPKDKDNNWKNRRVEFILQK